MPFDTVVCDPGGLWVVNAFIISKTDSIISGYLYHFNYYDLPGFQRVPKGMADYLGQQETYDRYGNDIEVNRFFSIPKSNKEKIDSLWQNISAIKPWEMKDDRTYGIGCPIEVRSIQQGDTITVTEQSLDIMDGGTYILKLITKKGMEKLSYYMPEASEKQCPGKTGRQQMIALIETILKFYGKNSVFYVK